MSKKVLILSSSPRYRGNSDLLCDEFMKGTLNAGNEVEKIFLKDKKLIIVPDVAFAACTANLARKKTMPPK